MKRSDAQILVEAIDSQRSTEALTQWERGFLNDMRSRIRHYGATVTDKQGKVLQELYRKVYARI